ncbi:hypothetical protein G6F68_020715 [Rhizopus microsporus]|nr:hypothetical protein G6F68_020715 [Rhizopus microsporus]
MLDAIALTGDKARLHAGYIAQEVADAFYAEDRGGHGDAPTSAPAAARPAGRTGRNRGRCPGADPCGPGGAGGRVRPLAGAGRRGRPGR